MYRKILKLSTSVGLGQVLSLIFAPILARLYSPEEFGSYGLILSLIALLSGASTLRYEQAILISENNERKDVLDTVVILNLFMSLLFFLIVMILEFLGYITNLNSIWLMVGIFITSNYNIFRIYNLKVDNISKVTVVDLIKSLILNISQFTLSFSIIKKEGLIVGMIFSLLVPLLLYVKFSVWDIKKAKFSKKVFFKYNKFAKYSLPEYFINMLSQQLPIYYFYSIYDTYSVGLYVFADKIVRIPVQFLSKSVYQVICKEENLSFYQYFIKPTLMLSVVSSIVFIPIAIFGGDIVRIYLGEKWIDSGILISYLCLWMSFAFIKSPSSAFLTKNMMQKEMFSLELFGMLIKLSTLVISSKYTDFTITVLCFCVASAITNLMYIVFVYFKGHKNESTA